MIEYTNRKNKMSKTARQLSVGVMAIGLLFSQTAAHAAPAETNGSSFQRVSEVSKNFQSTSIAPSVVTASKDVKILFSNPIVTSTPAVKKVVPAVKVEQAPETVAPEASQATSEALVAPVQADTAPVETNPAEAIPVAAPVQAPTNNVQPDVSNGTKGAKIAAAALAQIGVTQDCTMLVTNSLKSVGINFHDWPAGYKSLGTITNNPVPGDLIYYVNGGTGWGHIAVYIGNGQAVHGGWNGNETRIGPANIGSTPVYIHVS